MEDQFVLRVPVRLAEEVRRHARGEASTDMSITATGKLYRPAHSS
jgi:hypothetical protein